MTISKAKQAEKEAAEKAQAEKEAAEKDKKPPYYMAEGKAVTSLKGILGHPTEVKAKYFTGGQKRLDELVDSGHVVKA